MTSSYFGSGILVTKHWPELSQNEGEAPKTVKANARKNTGLNGKDPKLAQSRSNPVETDGTLESDAKKRKRPTVEGPKIASAAKKPAPSRKRKKQEVPIAGETTTMSSGSLPPIG